MNDTKLSILPNYPITKYLAYICFTATGGISITLKHMSGQGAHHPGDRQLCVGWMDVVQACNQEMIYRQQIQKGKQWY